MKNLKDYILEKSWDKYQQGVYPEDSIKSAIYDYVSGMTSGVNYDLRKGNTRGSKQVIDKLDSAFKDVNYADYKILNVWRTVDWDYMKNVYGATKENIKDFIGKTFENKGYMSTTKKFGSPWGKCWMKDDLVMHITSKDPYPVLDINRIFKPSEIDCYDQEEYLLQRNTKLVLKSIYYNKNKYKTIELNMEIES